MKKYLLLSLLLIIVSFAFANSDDEIKEVVKLESSTANNERSLCIVVCTIDRYQHCVDIVYEGIGIPTAYILDSNGNMCSFMCGGFTEGTIKLDLPDISGVYQIIVYSETYTGIGTIVVP